MLLTDVTPFNSSSEPAEYYDDLREEQHEDFETFANISQNIINHNIYDSYKAYFYRYQDYNQINR